ncbi:MAG: aspartate carbamoyltransferase catalytic subunit [Phycisphaerae bacterium]|nr:aspartate carbamoyltransferase catalytic subunit [Phycisphaerae bacterium]
MPRTVRTVESAARTEPLAWTRKHLLGLEDLSRAELLHALDTATGFKSVSTRSIKKVPALRGKVVVNLFFEDSTRTRMSFALAAQRLSADVLEFSKSASSVNKGETLIDTARNIEAMGVDIMVIRHAAAGAPLMLARSVKCAVVNAGDGQHEHPTQGLLDLFTMREIKGHIEGLTVAIVGDIAHSRVARSNIHGLRTLGARVIVVGPNTLIPTQIEKMGVEVSSDFDAVLPQCDVVNMLRVQFERIQSSQFPSVPEYHRLFGLHKERFKRAKKDVLILHPGPINRGLELDSAIADGPNSGILRQVSNGLAVRMGVLYLVNQAMLAESEI